MDLLELLQYGFRKDNLGVDQGPASVAFRLGYLTRDMTRGILNDAV